MVALPEFESLAASCRFLVNRWMRTQKDLPVENISVLVRVEDVRCG